MHRSIHALIAYHTPGIYSMFAPKMILPDFWTFFIAIIRKMLIHGENEMEANKKNVTFAGLVYIYFSK